jgi:hypothetical protein
MKLIICCIACTLFAESITDKDSSYLDMCRKAASMPYYFQNFRSLPEYNHVLEISDGKPFADYLLDEASDETWKKMPQFKALESFGNPSTSYYAFIGNFSATTLRYIAIADEIERLFDLPSEPRIVEIGGGFGGQAYVLSRFHPRCSYSIIDLPEPLALLQKMAEALGLPNIGCFAPEETFPEWKIDLFISNYAYSECDRKTQIDYFERVIKKADRGYLIYNQISDIYGVESLSPFEFLKLLEENGMKPQVARETIPTFDTNLRITWDRTR